jgi:2,3-bisphosphoglycerate-dependent phosphoglycerate mutase
MQPPDCKKLILVRHAETEFNAARVIQMPAAVLSEHGRTQAKLLARRLAGAGVTRILSSDLPRAVETAQFVSISTGVAVEQEPALRERDFGDLRGRSYDSLPFNPLPADFSPPNGESSDTFYARLASAWQRIVAGAAETSGNLLVVTHGLVCRALVSRYVEPGSVGEIPKAWFNTSVTEISAVAPWTAARVNCVAHLSAQARSN